MPKREYKFKVPRDKWVVWFQKDKNHQPSKLFFKGCSKSAIYDVLGLKHYKILGIYKDIRNINKKEIKYENK